MLIAASFHPGERDTFQIAGSITEAHNRVGGEFDHSTRITPLAPQRLSHRVIPSLPKNLHEHAIDEDDEDEGESSGADTMTRPNQHGDKVTTSSKTKFV